MPERAADLLSTLPPDVHDDAQRLYEEAGRTVDGGPDPRDIVGELHRRGLLDESQLRDAVLALESTLKVRRSGDRPPVDASKPQVLGRLGAGAMGEVLIAKDPGLNRIVAVKRLLPEGAKRKTMLRRFYTEAQVTAQLDHPSVVPIHGLVETDDGGLAYSMKLVRGETLEDYLEAARDQYRLGRPDPRHDLPARLERFLHVCDALAYAHERGVLHRDLKPENIMVGAFGEVLVMDWGIAKLLDRPEAAADDEDEYGSMGGPTGPSASSAKETRVGTVMGTPRYMSPEQAMGRTDILDPRSDQYALGLILFEVVGLGPAVRPDLTLEEAVDWAENGRKQPLVHDFGDRIPRELAGIVDKATQREPDLRYASVAELAEDVRRFLRDEPVLARPDGVLQKIQRWLGRHRQAALNLLFLMAMGIVATGAFGMVLTVGTVAVINHRAQVREQQITGVNRIVVQRAREIEAELFRLEGLLHGLTYAAGQALVTPPSNLPYNPATSAPPGARASKYYRKPVTVDWPRLTTPPGANPRRDDLASLASLGPQLGRVLADSARNSPLKYSAKDRHQIVAERGAGVVWARVTTRDGVEAVAPGTGAPATDAPDPRKEEWFKTARKKNAVWTGPRVDERGMGLVLTAAMPIRDLDGAGLGVAAVDVSLDHLARVVRVPDFAEGGWLIDDKGMVVVHNKIDARNTHTYDPAPFPRTPVRDAILTGPRQGWVDTSDGQIAVWSRLPSLDLTFVIVGPAAELIAAEARRSAGRAD